MKDRYVPIYDSGDWILDTKTGEYLHLEEACTRLNEVTEDCTKMAQAYNDFIQMINDATQLMNRRTLK